MPKPNSFRSLLPLPPGSTDSPVDLLSWEREHSASNRPGSIDAGPKLPPLRLRAYQKAVRAAGNQAGILALLWRRQAGKTTTLADLCLKKMFKQPGRLVTFASVSLLLGREIIFKESQVLRRALAQLEAQSNRAHDLLQVVDTRSKVGRGVPPSRPSLLTFSPDDFADIFEAQRLEFRLYHSRSVYSRTQVIAPNPATARGWTGDVMLDEVGFIRDFRALWEAMEPIVSSDPDFRVLMATTPPEDDDHFVFELLAPTEAIQFPVNPAGNWYRSGTGILVHRCDIFDAAAAGAQVYDLETRQPITPDEHFARALDKDAWRRNYGLQFLPGGASAVSLAALSRAQRAGEGQCFCAVIDRPEDLERGLEFLRLKLGSGPVGVGLDLATTEKLRSNPSALAVLEQMNGLSLARLILVWKSADPQWSERLLLQVLEAISSRPAGGPTRRLCIDATNERYFAVALRQRLGEELEVELVVASELKRVPGEREPISFKAWLGHELLKALDEGRLALPSESYVKDDFRLVKRSKGSFESEVSPQGMHGDVFDACKLAYRAVTEDEPGPSGMVA